MTTTATGDQLAQGVRNKLEELRKACAGIDEATASQSPAGRWSPKMILSHLAGQPGSGHLPLLRDFLDKEVPLLEIEAENPFYDGGRADMTFAQLLGEVEKEYEGVAAFTRGLTPEQLARKAHVPLLKETAFGEYPTLGQMIFGLGEYHVQYHVDHLKEVLALIAAEPNKPGDPVPVSSELRPERS